MSNYFYIKPKPRKSAQGRHLVVHKDGRPASSVKAPGAGTTFSILKLRNGLLNTGLTYTVPNPYHRVPENVPTKWTSYNMDKKERITRQEELEMKYGLNPGELTNIPGRDHKNATYLELFRHYLEDTENRVSLDSLKGEVFYEAARASSLIANSLDEAMTSPYAMFYISKVNENEESKAKRNRLKAKGNAILEELASKYTPTVMRNMAVVLRLINRDINEEGVYNALYDYVNDTSKYSINVPVLQDHYNMMTNAKKKKKFEALVLLRDLVNWGVLIEDRGTFYWTTKRGTSLEQIGKTEEVALEFLLDKGNEPYVEELTKELKVRKNEY